MKGQLTNIQRFSLNDGAGIRTTVFFKGCNMRCKWCHNPETISMGPSLMYYKTKCIGCGHCVEVCPHDALSLDANGGGITIDRDRCTVCGDCEAACTPGALVVVGKPATVEEVMAEVVQDKAYYKRSGGGVTLSGGEALCQPEFAAALAEACAREGIDVAVETNLLFDFDRVKPVLKLFSHIYADIKLMDEDAHREWTGASNRQVLKNAKLLGSLNVPITIRTPLIPGVTDTADNIGRISAFVAEIENVERYELLNFNPLGAGKYEGLSQDNYFHSARPHGQARLEAIGQVARASGVPVVIT